MCLWIVLGDQGCLASIKVSKAVLELIKPLECVFRSVNVRCGGVSPGQLIRPLTVLTLTLRFGRSTLQSALLSPALILIRQCQLFIVT